MKALLLISILMLTITIPLLIEKDDRKCTIGTYWVNPYTDNSSFITDDYSKVEKAYKEASFKTIIVEIGRCNGKMYYYFGEMATEPTAKASTTPQENQ